MHRSSIFRACRKQLAATTTNTDDLVSWDEGVELSASIRVDDLSIPQCKDVFNILHAAMKASGEPNTVPTDAQIESFLKLVLGHDKSLLEWEIASKVGEENFDPEVKTLVGVSKSAQEPVYGHLDLIRSSEICYSLSVAKKHVEGWGAWEDPPPTTISPNDVQFTCKEPTQWMSQLTEKARLKAFKYICNSNLLIAIRAARWCINVRLMCKEPYVPSLKHYLSLARPEARPFVCLSKFFYNHPFLAIICVERPRTVFDELSPGSEMLVKMMQKIQRKTKEAEFIVPEDGRSSGNGLESIVEEGEEGNSYEEGEDTPAEEEDAYEGGVYEYEDEGFDDEDEGWDYEDQDE